MSDQSLRSQATHGVVWSVVQNWGGKLLTFALSILLARVLSPEEFGVASSALLMLTLIPIVAELGFGDAIMQRRNLKSMDLNLPFYVAVLMAVVMVAVIVIFSGNIGAWLGVSDFSLYVAVIAGTALINAPTLFQEAVFKRNLRFRSLAFRTFLANVTGGLAALSCAVAGFGVWSFVVQAYVVSLISFAWLWRRPLWVPSGIIDLQAFREMIRFGAPVVAQRLVDFVGTKTIDVVIVSSLGLTAYGFYVVGSRLYLTVLQLLQGALYDVSLTVLSKISAERERLAAVYLKTIRLSAQFISPVFIALAAVAPELCDMLFGKTWDGVAGVAAPLLILGSVQCVQFMNGAFLSSRGRPELTLITGVCKALSALLFLALIPSENVAEMTMIFVLSQFIATPLSFVLTSREIGVSLVQIVFKVVPSLVLASIAYAAVTFLRPYVSGAVDAVLLRAAILTLVYFIFWISLMAIFDWRGLNELLGIVLKKALARRQAKSE